MRIHPHDSTKSQKYRIVYRIINPEKIEIVEIWGIGKGEKEEIY